MPLRLALVLAVMTTGACGSTDPPATESDGDLVAAVDLDASRVAEVALEAALPFDEDPAGAVLIVENATGQVLGRAVRGPEHTPAPLAGGARPAGSVMKTLVLATAFTQQLSAEHILQAPICVEIEGMSACGGDGRPVSMLEATVRSINPAFVFLTLEIGAGRAVELAAAFGIDVSPDGSIPLGVDPVSMESLAAVFVALSNDGLARPIVDAEGQVIVDVEGRVISEDAARSTAAALREVVARGTGMAADGDDRPFGKTGTADRRTDGWFAGSTSHHTIIVWIGSPDGQTSVAPPTARRELSGGGWPAEIFRMVADGMANH